jgi:WD40 repeat protein
MKTTSKLLIALILALLLSGVGLTVWAGTSTRQGTVRNPPITNPITPIIPVTGGTYTVSTLCGCSEKGTTIRISDPEKAIGPSPSGFVYLTDAVKVELQSACDIEICYPYPKDYENQKGQIYIWDTLNKKWNVVDSSINGNPKQICSVDKISTGKIYALISADKIFSMKTLDELTQCGCTKDLKITNLQNPNSEVGAAPAGLKILTDDSKVECLQAPCEVQACFPNKDEYKLNNAQLYEWDKNAGEWNLFQSAVSGDPAQICGVKECSDGGIFTLMGK